MFDSCFLCWGIELGTDGVVWYGMVWYGEEIVVFLEGDSGMDGRVGGWKEWRRRKEGGGRREEEGRMVGRTDGIGVVVWMCGVLYNNCIRRCIGQMIGTPQCQGEGGCRDCTVCGILVLERCSRALAARIWLGR